MNYEEEIKDLKDRLRKLEDAKIKNESITAGELLYLSDRIAMLERALPGLSGMRISTQPPMNTATYPGAQPQMPPMPSGMSPAVGVDSWNPPYPGVQPSPPFVHPMQPAQIPGQGIGQTKPRRQISETLVGKYGVGILASILVLLGVYTGVQLFWAYIPNVVKFGVLLLLGAVVSVVGFVQTKKQKGNGFWPSIAATGAAILYIALASGTLAWGLYGNLALGGLLFLWFVVCIYASGMLNSRVFYIVSYIGSTLSLFLALLQMEMTGDVQAVYGFVILSIAMPAIGLIQQKKNSLLPFLNYVFLMGIAFMAMRAIRIWNNAAFLEEAEGIERNGQDGALTASLAAMAGSFRLSVIMMAAEFLSSTLALYESQKIVWKKGFKYHVFIVYAAGLLSAYVMFESLLQYCPAFDKLPFKENAAGAILILAILCIGCVFRWKKGPDGQDTAGSDAWAGQPISSATGGPDGQVSARPDSRAGQGQPMPAAMGGPDGSDSARPDSRAGQGQPIPAAIREFESYVMTAALPLACASVLPLHGILPISPFLPAILLLSACLLAGKFSEAKRYWKFSVYVFYFAVIYMVLAHDYDNTAQILQTLPAALCGLFLYLKSSGYIMPFLVALTAMLPVSLCCRIEFFYDVPEIVPIGAVVIMVMWNKLRLLQDEESSPWKLCALVLTHVATAILHFFIYLTTFSLFGSVTLTAFEKSLNTTLLMGMSVVSVYEAVLKGSILFAALSMFAFNLNMWYIADLVAEESISFLAISIIGIVLAAAFIALGFGLRKKSLRIIGLITMIIYVLKISIIDLSESAARGMNVLLLIAGGLVCFGISFLYNRLDKKYGGEDALH